MITNRNLILWIGAVLLVICASHTSASNRNENCLTPNDTLGTCLPIALCPFIEKILLQRPVQFSNIQYLKRSQCGNEGRLVLVCCPEVSRTDTKPLKGSLPEPGVCGKMYSDRIYGGRETKIDEHPWLALLEYNKGRKRKGFHCGGILINEKYVLTAAHCVTAIPPSWSLINVRLGEWDLLQQPDCSVDPLGHQDCAPPHLDVAIEKIITHENYVSTDRNQVHDIALLRLASVIAFNDFIRPICLPVDGQLRTNDFVEHRMSIVGWGKTEKATMSNKKLMADVTVTTMNDCKAVYSDASVIISRTHLCAGGEEGVDSCRGDSGGPLIGQFLNNQSMPYAFIAGIISFGPSPCGSPGWPGVYTRVSEYVDWVKNNILP